MAAGARIGTEFAGYRVEAVLARGGSSVVYRAEYPRLGIPVALKLLNPDAAEDESFRERFVRESRLAAAVNHPNIITIYDAGVWEDTLYIALRFIADGDLRVRIRDGPLELERALGLLAQVASALDAAHAHGLVHRDVKPANIMVDSGPAESAPEVAYVTDFGLIKHVASGARATPTGEFLGTIDYVAPEQIEGRPVDARADVYSLGCVVFECLTGRVPFERENDAAILWAHMQEEPPAATSLRADLPAGVDEAIARALAKEPEGRHRSCGEFLEDIRESVGQDRAGAMTEAFPVRPPRRGRRRRPVPMVAGVVAGLALGAAGASVAVLAVEGDQGAGAGAVAATVTVTRTATATVTRTETVNERSAFLLTRIPDGFRRSCRRAATAAADFWDTYACRPRRGVVVRYSYARSGALLTAYFQRRYVRAGLARPDEGERAPYAPSCGAPAPVAMEEWNYSGAAGHQLVGRSEFGDTDGRVLCVQGESGRRSRIEWTTPVLGVYAYAEGDNYAALLNWWLENAGPLR
jgi:tRNA A-37 threonylcarbamoyl transferase component Bud32